MLGLVLRKRVDDVAQGQQRPVDVSALFQADAAVLECFLSLVKLGSRKL